ncbi:MAG: hypothetical protein V1721_01525 [Pseudomonadota bacterium]
MMFNRKILFSVLALVLFVGISVSVLHAEQTDGKTAHSVAQQNQSPIPEKMTLDGKEYTREQLIEDFINIAFSKKDWPDDESSLSERISSWFKHKKECREHVPSYVPPWAAETPWLSEYLFRRKGIPNCEGIYKWTRQEVGIGFNFPAINVWGMKDTGHPTEEEMEPCQLSTEPTQFVDELKRGGHRDIVDHVNALIPELEKITGLNLRVQLSADKSCQTENYARIRIVPVASNPQKNFFKIYRYRKPPKGHDITEEEWHLQRHENDLFGAVSYTTDIRSQVDGYLLPEADNSLGLSVCKIMPAVGPEMMKALITECLLRALGLPDISKHNDHTLLGNWNKEYDRFSKLQDLDGKKEAFSEGWYIHTEFPEIGKDLRPYMAFSDYDKMMVRLLYCPEIRAGMKKDQVRKVLSENGKCFIFSNKVI